MIDLLLGFAAGLIVGLIPAVHDRVKKLWARLTGSAS